MIVYIPIKHCLSTNEGMIILQEMAFFNKNLNDLSLEIFGPNISTRWDRKEKALKDELTNCLVGLFRQDTFDTSKVLQKVGKHLEIV